MKAKIYTGVLVLAMVAVSLLSAVYANGLTGDAADAGSDDTCTSNAQNANQCTQEQNCGQPGCGALENKPCGCQGVCQIR